MQNCPICQNLSVKIFTHKLYKSIYREFFLCSECNFIFVPKDFHIDNQFELERYQNHKNNIFDEKFSFEENIINNNYLKILDNFLDLVIEKCNLTTDKQINHLDYGSGPNPNLSKLLSIKLICTSFDFDTFYSPLELNDLNSKIDLITSTEVWEHFRNPIFDIENQINLLKKKGYLAIMTNMTDFLFDDNIISNIKFKQWWYKNDITHISYYHSKTIEYIAKKYNLNLIYNNNSNIFILQK